MSNNHLRFAQKDLKSNTFSPNDDLVMMNPMIEEIKHHLEQDQELGVMCICHHPAHFGGHVL